MPVREGVPPTPLLFCIGVPLQCRVLRPLALSRDVVVWVWVWASTARSLCPQRHRTGSLVRRKISLVNVAAWRDANGTFVGAEPFLCGRTAACMQAGGLQAARRLSQQGWVCVTVFTLQCVQGPFREKRHSNTVFYLFIIIIFKLACFFHFPVSFLHSTRAQKFPFKSLISVFPSESAGARLSDSISVSSER